MTSGVVVGCVFLTSDELFRVEELSVGSGTYFVCKQRRNRTLLEYEHSISYENMKYILIDSRHEFTNNEYVPRSCQCLNLTFTTIITQLSIKCGPMYLLWEIRKLMNQNSGLDTVC